MEESGFSAQLRFSIETLMTPEGAIAAFIWLLLLIAIIFSPKAKWIALVGMMWCAALSFYVEEHVPVHLATPLDQIRSHGRLLCTAFLTALILPAVLAPRGWRYRVVSTPLAFFLLLEMMFGLRVLSTGLADRGVVSLIVFPMMFAVLAWGAAKWMQDWDSVHRLVRCIAITACVYVLGCCYQLLMNSTVIIRGHRLMGTSGNPQWAAMLIGMALPAACYLVARASEPIAWRVLLAAFVGLMIIMLVWTGSRTGILIALTGVLLTFWARLGRFLVVGFIVGIFVLLAMQIYDESTASLSDMFTRGDTRSIVWSGLTDAFLNNPAFGAMRANYGIGESSYLSVAANMGIYGLIPLTLFLTTTIWSLVSLFRARSLLGSEKPFADMAIGGVVALLVGAGFEGFFLGTLTFPVFSVYLYLGFVSFALDAVTAAEHRANLPDGGMSVADDSGQVHIPPHGQFVEQYL